MNIVKYTSEYQHLANDFDCGNIVINKFLKGSNALDKTQGITYVLLSDNKDFIIGYYNIGVGRIDMVEKVGDIINYIPMGGTVNINYLAIRSKFQHKKIGILKNGQGFYIGDYLLHDCENRISDISELVGIMFITLNSTEDGFNLYHNRNSYVNFEEDMNTFITERDIDCYRLYKCLDDVL